MESTSQQRALDVLEASLDLPEAERLRILADASAADPAVAAELRRLNAVRTSAAALLPTDTGLATPPSADTPAAAPPQQIGVYRLVRVVGRGGMGTVYEGLRSDGLFDQKVAIKLLARRRWSAELERRFVTERRILAKLQHRNIARIYDGGVTAEGQSFIVMEFIDGKPITEFANVHGLDLRGRLTLLSQLCAALQFAHQQLVVHADIKPSNVLVADDGSVKLLDFGIAQLLGVDSGNISGNDTASGLGSREPLTAAYAAPERSAGGPATVASDVYSMGIVLRELLAGRAVTKAAGITTAAGATTVPGATAAAGATAVPTDLQAIIDKSVGVNPDARYGSIAALASDLSRWQRRLPVSAVSATLPYRARLFVARNRAAVIIGSITLLGLAAATVVSTRSYFAAEHARAAETRRFEEVRDLNSYLVGGLSDQMLDRPGMIDAHSQTLDDARVRLERLAASRPDDASLQIELGRDILRIARSSFTAALPAHIDLVQVRANLAAANNRLVHLGAAAADLPGYWEVRAEIEALQAGALVSLDGNAAQAERTAVQSIVLAREALRRRPTSIDAQTSSVITQLAFSRALNGSGKQAQAIAVLDQALSVAENRSERELLAAPGLLRAIVDAQFQRCDIKRWSYVDGRALSDCSTVEQRLRRLVRMQGPLIGYESRLAYTLFLMATLLPQPADSPRALLMLDEAQQTYARILYFGANEELSGNKLVVDSARAYVLASLGRFAEARAVARVLLDQRRARFMQQPNNHARQREVATALRRVGEVELTAHQPKAACAAFTEAGAIWDQMQRDGTLLGFDLAPASGQAPWIRSQLTHCRGS